MKGVFLKTKECFNLFPFKRLSGRNLTTSVFSRLHVLVKAGRKFLQLTEILTWMEVGWGVQFSPFFCVCDHSDPSIKRFPGSAGAVAHPELQTDAPWGYFPQKCLEEPLCDSSQNYMFYHVRIIKILWFYSIGKGHSLIIGPLKSEWSNVTSPWLMPGDS